LTSVSLTSLFFCFCIQYITIFVSQDAVAQLTREIREIQAAGDKLGAKKMMDEFARLPENVAASLRKLGSLNIPVDVESIRLWDD
jgi:hypothetical protein